jgi:FtsH-binding integral membrane protein
MEYSVYENENMSFSKYLSKCFLWMFLGLLATFATAAIFTYTDLYFDIFMSMGTGFIIFASIIEIVLVLSLSFMINRISVGKALTLFFVYSIVNGITLSSIFYLYDLTSIIYVFLGSASVFGIMSLVGYRTKLDLSKLRNFIPIALISMLIVGIILMFSFNSFAYLIYTLIGIGLFMIITTYDIHVIKNMYYGVNNDGQRNSLAIYGALQLYLDFINLFLRLLSLFGKSRD